MPNDEMPPNESGPADTPPNETGPAAPQGRFGRLAGMRGRPLLLIVVGLILLVVVLSGGCSGVEISESQALATARAALEADDGAFTPERTEAKILRQGFPPTPMWVVVFTVQDPEGGSEDFLQHAAIWVNATSGELRQVIVGESGDG